MYELLKQLLCMGFHGLWYFYWPLNQTEQSVYLVNDGFMRISCPRTAVCVSCMTVHYATGKSWCASLYPTDNWPGEIVLIVNPADGSGTDVCSPLEINQTDFRQSVCALS